jgi:hypothetical protein
MTVAVSSLLCQPSEKKAAVDGVSENACSIFAWRAID